MSSRILLVIFVSSCIGLGCTAGAEGPRNDTGGGEQNASPEGRLSGIWKTERGHLVLRQRVDTNEFLYYEADDFLVEGAYSVENASLTATGFGGVLVLTPRWFARDLQSSYPSYTPKRPIRTRMQFAVGSDGPTMRVYDEPELPLGPALNFDSIPVTGIPESAPLHNDGLLVATAWGAGASSFVGGWTFPEGSPGGTQGAKQVTDFPITVSPAGTMRYAAVHKPCSLPLWFCEDTCVAHISGTWRTEPLPHTIKSKERRVYDQPVETYRTVLDLIDYDPNVTDGCDPDSSLRLTVWDLEYRTPDHLVFHYNEDGHTAGAPLSTVDYALVNAWHGLVRAEKPAKWRAAAGATSVRMTGQVPAGALQLRWIPSSAWSPGTRSTSRDVVVPMGQSTGGSYTSDVTAPPVSDDVYVGVVERRNGASVTHRSTRMVLFNPGVVTSLPTGLGCFEVDEASLDPAAAHVLLRPLGDCLGVDVN